MTNSLYILLILFNLNLLLVVYVEIMIKIISLINYKNTPSFLNKFFFLDNLMYYLYKNKYVSKLAISL